MSQLLQIQPLSQPVDIGDEVASFSPEVEKEIDWHLAKYPVTRSAILPLMFIVQRERGYLDPPGVAYLANRLRLRITDIWEVATFYSMLNTTAGRQVSHSDLQNAFVQDHGRAGNHGARLQQAGNQAR